MRFRLGFASGFAAGYYLGAKAGRERYEQIHSRIQQVKRSDAFRSATDKAKDAIGEGMEKAKDKAMDLVHRGSDSNGSTNGHISSHDVRATQAGTPGPATAYAPDADL